MAQIEFIDVSFTYAGHNVPAIQHIDCTVQQGQWIVICGASGSGKTTLLKRLKPDLLPNGIHEGHIRIADRPIDAYTQRESAMLLALVTQHAEHQIVMDRVTEELVFSMENVGLPPQVIRKRLAEMAQLIDIQSLLEHSTMHLSGGQQQAISLASVLMLQPKILLLDEPLAQLDPIAADHMLQFIANIHRDYGMTIIMTTHRLEDVWAVADEVWHMDHGALTFRGSKKQFAQHPDPRVAAYLPATSRLMLDLGFEDQVAASHSDMRKQLASCAWVVPPPQLEARSPDHPLESGAITAKRIVTARDVRFRHRKDSHWVCDNLSLDIYQGEIIALCGANGSGKSTLLQLIAGLLKTQQGTCSRADKLSVGYVSQQPLLHFLEETVELQLRATGQQLASRGIIVNALQFAEPYDLTELFAHHPHDLSGGERQRLALACAMMAHPQLLVLDEPTKGLDPHHKQIITQLLHNYHQQGTTILLATHDIEFAAEIATRCILLFDGTIVADDHPTAFFSENYYYTTAVHRLARPWVPYAIHRGEVIEACLGKS